jgi:Flp pilus assembly protein TadD
VVTVSRRSKTFHFQQFASVALTMGVGLVLAGCMRTAPGDMTVAPGGAAAGDGASTHSSDAQTAVRYARELRANGLRGQAVAVLARAANEHPREPLVLAAYGGALADIGRYRQAFDVFERAHAPGRPDWRILSVQGAVLDQMGRHEEAQRYYGTALRIVPDEPSVLSNLGLSYALSKDLVRAEATLRRAAGLAHVDARVRQNLTLVVALQGRSSEADSMAHGELPSQAVAANTAVLRRMLAQQNGWQPPGQQFVKAEGG